MSEEEISEISSNISEEEEIKETKSNIEIETEDKILEIIRRRIIIPRKLSMELAKYVQPGDDRYQEFRLYQWVKVVDLVDYIADLRKGEIQYAQVRSDMLKKFNTISKRPSATKGFVDNVLYVDARNQIVHDYYANLRLILSGRVGGSTKAGVVNNDSEKKTIEILASSEYITCSGNCINGQELNEYYVA